MPRMGSLSAEVVSSFSQIREKAFSLASSLTQPRISYGMMWSRLKSRLQSMPDDLPFGEIPPNVQHLQRVQSGEPFPAEPDATSVDEFTSFVNPFAHTLTESLRVPA
jgi:hypothetical protein